jgi:hypothetical protein
MACGISACAAAGWRRRALHQRRDGASRDPATNVVLLCAAVACLHTQGIVYGKPVNQGITQLKPNRNHRSMAEERAGRKLGALRVLNSYWVNQVRERQCQGACGDTSRSAPRLACSSHGLVCAGNR